MGQSLLSSIGQLGDCLSGKNDLINPPTFRYLGLFNSILFKTLLVVVLPREGIIVCVKKVMCLCVVVWMNLKKKCYRVSL